MTDKEFLGYVEIHCETPRALFSNEHCVRLYRLAGHKMADPSSGFHAMHESEAKPLMELARARIKGGLVRPDYQALCDRFGIKLHRGGPPGADMTDRCSCYGCNIVIGKYEDVELEVISFFHELGHCISGKEHCLPEYENWPYDAYAEAVAWKLGLRYAAREGIRFSDKAKAWASTQLTTYFKDDCSEHTPMKHLPFALRTAGLLSFVTLEEAVASRMDTVGVNIGLEAEDPWWAANDFPPEVQSRMKEARHQWSEATKVALAHAKKEYE